VDIVLQVEVHQVEVEDLVRQAEVLVDPAHLDLVHLDPEEEGGIDFPLFFSGF